MDASAAWLVSDGAEPAVAEAMLEACPPCNEREQVRFELLSKGGRLPPSLGLDTSRRPPSAPPTALDEHGRVAASLGYLSWQLQCQSRVR